MLLTAKNHPRDHRKRLPQLLILLLHDHLLFLLFLLLFMLLLFVHLLVAMSVRFCCSNFLPYLAHLLLTGPTTQALHSHVASDQFFNAFHFPLVVSRDRRHVRLKSSVSSSFLSSSLLYRRRHHHFQHRFCIDHPRFYHAPSRCPYFTFALSFVGYLSRVLRIFHPLLSIISNIPLPSAHWALSTELVLSLFSPPLLHNLYVSTIPDLYRSHNLLLHVHHPYSLVPPPFAFTPFFPPDHHLS